MISQCCMVRCSTALAGPLANVSYRVSMHKQDARKQVVCWSGTREITPRPKMSEELVHALVVDVNFYC